MKRVDTAVYTFYKLAAQNKLGAGHDLVFDLKNGGQDVGKISKKAPAALRRQDERREGEDHQRQDQGPEHALGVTGTGSLEGAP